MTDVTVHLDEWAAPDEVAAVEQAVQSIGLSAAVDTDWRKEPGTGNGAFWMVAITVGVPLIASFKRFAERLAERAADDAYDLLRSLVKRIRDARRSAAAPDGWVEFEDSDGTRLMIGRGAEEAFDKLREMGPDAVRGRHLRWDERTREWVEY